MKLKLAIAQTNPVVGDFEQNTKKILEAYETSSRNGARFLITPELGVCGYPPHDLVERPEIFERSDRAIEFLKSKTKNSNCALIVGGVAQNTKGIGKKALNQAYVLEKGEVVLTQAKTLLPTYDVFDEARYFESAEKIKAWVCDGVPIGIGICEDLWFGDFKNRKSTYAKDPIDSFIEQKVQMVLSLAASPYEWNKRAHREGLHCSIASRLKIPLVYVNQVGATDEILFDGASFIAGPDGKVLGQLPVFEESCGVFDLEVKKWINLKETKTQQSVSEEEALRRGLILGISDYFSKNKFKKAVIGLSGGIDSAVVATLAVNALGAENVLGVAMPGLYSSSHSLEDAEELANRLKIRFEVKPIKFLFTNFVRELAGIGKNLAEVAEENLQARIRGLILMTLANEQNALVITTGNKSELATGYCTLYGDMVGAIAPIGDLFKTKVYQLAHYLNEFYGGIIPKNSIDKAPSAELRPNQTDQDTLPPYDKLDALLEDYLEKNLSIDEVKAKYAVTGQKNWVIETLTRVENNEFKRIQAAPVFKLGPKAFGMGRRVPVTKVWKKPEFS